MQPPTSCSQEIGRHRQPDNRRLLGGMPSPDCPNRLETPAGFGNLRNAGIAPDALQAMAALDSRLTVAKPRMVMISEPER